MATHPEQPTQPPRIEDILCKLCTLTVGEFRLIDPEMQEVLWPLIGLLQERNKKGCE